MYCSHFGLHRPPFNNTPDPSFYYSTPDHEEALATLQYATLNRKGFVLVTGEVGAGKTLIGRMFIRQIDRQASTAVITHTQLNARQLLAAICSEFELDVSADATNLQLAERLQEYLLDQFARDRYVVVLLDEGQNLPDDSFEALRMLGNLEADDAKLLQVCILGQPELRERFKKESMRQIDQRLFRRFHLPALNQQQMVEYVQKRLSVAGCTRADLFTPAALDRVFIGSCGIPRVINQICDNALLAAYAQGLETVDEAIVTQVIEQEGLTDQAGVPQAARGDRNAEDAALTGSEYAGESGFVAVQSADQQTQARIEQIYGSSPELIETDINPSGSLHSTATAVEPESLKVDDRNQGFGSSDYSDVSGFHTFRNVLSGAAQQWPAVRQAINSQKQELQRAIDEVTLRCRQAQEQIEGLAMTAAPANELDELRKLHENETKRVLDEIARCRADIEQMVSQTETRLCETDTQLRSIRSNALTREMIDAVEEQQKRRVQEAQKSFEQYRGHIDDLVQLLRHQCDQTQNSIAGVAESCTKIRSELTDRMDSKLAELNRALQQQLQAVNPAEQIDSLREAQARTRSDLSSQFETRLVELQERIHRQISITASQEAEAIRAWQARDQEEQTRQLEQKLAEVNARLQEQLNAAAKTADVELIRHTTAKIADLESLRHAMVKPGDLEDVREASKRTTGAIRADLENQIQQSHQDLRKRVRRTVHELTTLREAQDQLREAQDRQHTNLREELQENLASTREQLHGEIVGTSQELVSLQLSAEQAYSGLTQRLDQAEVRQQGLLAEHKSLIDDLARGVVRCDGQINALAQDTNERIAAVMSNLAELKSTTASSTDVATLREQHENAVADISTKLEAKSTELADMKTSLNGLLARASQAQAAGLQALSARLDDESRQIRQIRQRLIEAHATLQEKLNTLQQECASKTAVEELSRAQDENAALIAAEIQAVRQNAQEQINTLQQDCATRAEVAELKRIHSEEVAHVAEEIQATRQTTQEQMNALQEECATRTDVEEIRRAQVEQAAQVAEEIQTGHQAVKGLIDGLGERLAAAQQRVEILAQFAKNDSQQLGEFRQTHAEDISNVLQQLEQQRELTQNRFEEAVADWTQTQQSLAELRATAASADDLEEVRRIQESSTDEIRKALTVQRQGLESLTLDVDHRCDALMARLDALPEQIATTDDIRAVQQEGASNKEIVEAAIRSVAEQCERTATNLHSLEERAASQDEVEHLRQDHARSIEAIVSRLEGSDNEYQQEFDALKQRWTELREELREVAKSSTSVEKFEAAEKLITDDLAALKQRLDEVSQRRSKDVHVLVDVAQRLTGRIRTLEEMERPEPVKIELTPQVAQELAQLKKAAEQQASELRNLLGNAGTVGDQLRAVSTQIEHVMRDWLANADLVQQQTIQLRESAETSANILQSLRKCNESIDAKLKSKRWQSSLKAGDDVAEHLERVTDQARNTVGQLQEGLARRVEQTTLVARKAIEQIQAALENYDQLKDGFETIAQQRIEARQTMERLSNILGEAKLTGQRLQQMTTRVGGIASGIAQKTAGLAELIEAAGDFDEQQRPTGVPSNGKGKARKSVSNVTPVNWPTYRTHPAVQVG